VIIHELGHIIAFYSIKKKFPPVKFTCFTIQVGAGEYIKGCTLVHIGVTALAGIFAGFIYLAIIDVSYLFWFVYLLACSLDIFTIYNIINTKIPLRTKLGNIEEKVVDNGY